MRGYQAQFNARLFGSLHAEQHSVMMRLEVADTVFASAPARHTSLFFVGRGAL